MGIDGNFALAFISLVGDDMVSWNGYTIATRPRETWKGCVRAKIVGMFLLPDQVGHMV
jgi:hypothetical protein